MNDTTIRPELARSLRKLFADAAIDGYEDALLSGLCHEGAWEAAVSAIRRVELSEFVDGTAEPGPPNAPASGGEGVAALTTLLAREVASPGPPAAGSGAAATGAIAAGLVEWVAAHSEDHGPDTFRQRARVIRARAATLQSALAGAAQQDADTVQRLIDGRGHETTPEVPVEAAESVLAIAVRCSQVVSLAAELATAACDDFHHDVLAALRLALGASECALDLFEANLPSEQDGSGWTRNVKRRASRIRLVLQSAAPRLTETRSG